MYKLTVNRFFDASHQLEDTDALLSKGCTNMHGHTYLARINFSSPNNNEEGMVVDFKHIKRIVDMFDHAHVNDVFEDEGFDEQATAENIARFIHNRIVEELPELDDVQVNICEGYKGETHSSWATYEE